MKCVYQRGPLYGYGEIGNANQLDEDIKRKLTLYLGVMFGIEKSAATLRVFTTNMSKQVLTKTSRRVLSKTALNHMGHRLSEVLRESIFYTEADYNKDYKNICNEVVDVEFN